MKTITINVNAASDQEAMIFKMALQNMVNNFNKENLIYIADLSKKPNVNEKFKNLRSNPFIKTFL